MDWNTLTFWAILIIAAAIVLAKAIDTFGDVRKTRHVSRAEAAKAETAGTTKPEHFDREMP